MISCGAVFATFTLMVLAPSESARPEGEEDPRCPAINPRIAKLIPHQEDCSSFYICESGIAVQKECPDDLHFNPKKGVCDYPDRAGCEKADGPGNVVPGKKSLLGDCPADGRLHLLPHPEDCDKFYSCENGVKSDEPKTCLEGLYFNRKLQVCDFPQNVACSARRARNVSPAPMEATGEPSPFCPMINGKLPIFYRNPANCSVFYMCGNGLAYEFVCPSGLAFNLRKKVCDHPSQAKCDAPS